MKRSFVWALAGALWLTALEAALRLQRLPDGLFQGHDICGPWGCGPPIPVLLACHGFWIAVIGPPASLAVWRLPARSVRWLGIGLFAAGACGLISVAVWEAATWWPHASTWQRAYVVRRYLFALATLVDIPIVEAVSIGAVLWLSGSRATVPTPRRFRMRRTDRREVPV